MAFHLSASRQTCLRVLAALVAGHIDPAAVHPDAWDRLCALALHQGMGPLLLWQVQAAGRGEVLQPVLGPLREARARNTVQHLLAVQTQTRVQAALAAAGIPCLWIKGIALAETLYPAPELRPMLDVDLLVPYDQRQAALAVLQRLGYSLLPQLFDGTESLKHHYALQGPAGDRTLVELHFRLLGAADRLLPIRDLDWFWQQSIPYGAAGYRTLRPEAHLPYLAAHALLQHGEADLRLLRYYDIHRLTLTTAHFDWDLLITGTTRLGWNYVTARALWLAQSFFATPLPDGILASLDARRPRHDTMPHVRRRRQPRTVSEQVMYDLITMEWRDRLRTAQRIVLPPPAYMRWRYAVDSPWQLPMTYAARWQHMGRDLWRTLRRKGVCHA